MAKMSAPVFWMLGCLYVTMGIVCLAAASWSVADYHAVLVGGYGFGLCFIGSGVVQFMLLRRVKRGLGYLNVATFWQELGSSSVRRRQNARAVAAAGAISAFGLLAGVITEVVTISLLTPAPS